MIQIIDYGAGNLMSVKNALKQLGHESEIISSVRDVMADAKLIFPGVGAAGSAMRALKRSHFSGVLPYLKQPFLGICLGMQLLSEFSEEGSTPGLALIRGKVRKFPSYVKIPQIGWNRVNFVADSPLFEGLTDGSYFYFVNSYYLDTDSSCVVGRTSYGIDFASVVCKDNFYGVQFHPEKSGEIGLKLLDNFCKSC